jgi:hypothetical protein
VLRSEATEFHYERETQPLPQTGPCQEQLDHLLAANEAKPSRECLTLILVFAELRGARLYRGVTTRCGVAVHTIQPLMPAAPAAAPAKAPAPAKAAAPSGPKLAL